MDQPYILAPQVVTVEFELQPVRSALETLRELNELDRLSGFGDWVVNTANALPAAVLQDNLLVSGAMFGMFMRDELIAHTHADLGGFVDALQDIDPVVMRDHLLDDFVTACKEHPEKMGGIENVTSEVLMHNYSTFRSILTKWIDTEEGTTQIDRLFVLINNPPGLHRLVVDHLRVMWTEWLKPEWERVLPLLQESVAAYRQNEFRDMTPYEVIRAVTGRDMSGLNDLDVSKITHMRLIPNAHIGPYIVRMEEDETLWVIFGARLPRGTSIAASALGRSELLVRLNALADDVRLRILELLTKHDEMCAQDIIEQLGLSQSSVSRHLSQLSATGYVIERRREVSKCYSINPERVTDTARALTTFLSRS